jgi:alcohol dehydrogenase class IV
MLVNMIPAFSFYRSPQVAFGAGSIGKLASSLAPFGKNILIITGGKSLEKSGKLDLIVHQLIGYTAYHTRVDGEPSPSMIDSLVKENATRSIDAVAAIGGGSVIDSAKAVAAMLPLNGESVVDFLEDVGKKSHPGYSVPVIAVPTTAGTGSEATKNAVLSQVGEHGFKKSLRHDNFVPVTVILDPELTLSCPPGFTAACGMDAFTQLLESFVSTKASPMTDALALSGINHVKNSLVDSATSSPLDIQKRGEMLYAAFLSGITLANAGLGVVHGIAGVIGGMFDIPHGVACGALLASCVKITVDRLMEDEAANCISLEKYAQAGRILSGETSGDIKSGCRRLIEILLDWSEKLNMPKLSAYGIKENDLEKISAIADSKSNPVQLNASDISRIIKSCL